MKRLVSILIICVAAALYAQQNQTSLAPLQPINTKYNNGVGVGYWPTINSGLVLSVATGTADCSGTMVAYSDGTLTLTASTTNYVYLNTSSSRVPATKTTAFRSSDIPIATVVTGTSTITTITDDRTMFVAPGAGAASTNPQMTVGSTLAAGSWSGFGIPATGLTIGSAYYVGSSGLALVEANASTTMPAACLAVATTLCAFNGVYRFSATQSWSVGASLYVSDATSGAMLAVASSTSGHYVQRIGQALAADTILIEPSVDVGVIQ